MKKVVINECYGGFNLSHEAVMRYAELKGITLYPLRSDLLIMPYYYSTMPVSNGIYETDSYFSPMDIARDDLLLIQCIEELGNRANGDCAKLKIVEIPDDVDFQIEEYDGMEWVAEKHQTWS